jgi:dTDP-4-dehydrorhamnose 3,5-epimerase-like enzyme
MNKPKLISFDKIGSPEIGFISIAETQKAIPFEIKRVYWTYDTPESIIRGGHAHKTLQQVLVAVNGSIEFELFDEHNSRSTFILDHPNQGLYIPERHWREIRFSNNAVLLCLASAIYDEADYVRDFNQFLSQPF